MVQIWNQHNTPETDLDEMEISDLPEKEFKIIVTKKTNYGHKDAH